MLLVLGSNVPFKNRVFAGLVLTLVTFKRFFDGNKPAVQAAGADPF